MSTSLVNDSVTVILPFFDDASAPVTGLDNTDFTESAYLTSDPTITAPVTVTSITGQPGNYGATFRPTSVGRWHVDSASTLNGEPVRWADDVEVITAQQADPVSYLGAVSVELITPLAPDGGTMRLIQGDSYAAAQSRSLSWTLTGQPDLTTATLTLRIVVKGITVEKTPLSGTNLASGAPTITATLTKLDTAGFDPVIGVFDLSAAIGSDEITLVRGRVYVEADV